MQFAFDLVEGRAGDANAARLGQLLKPRGDVHAIAVDGSVVLLDHIAQVDADAKLHAPVLGQLVVALGEFVLDFVGAVHGFDGAGEFGQDAVAGGVDESPAVGLDALAKEARDSLRARRVAASSSAISRE